MDIPVKKLSIAPRLWIFAGIIFVLVIAIEAYSLYLEKEQLKENFFREVRAVLETASSDIGPSLWLHQFDFLNGVLHPLANKPDVSFLNLSGPKGKRIYGSRDENFSELIEEFKAQGFPEYEADNHLLLRQTVVFNEEPQGHLVVGFSRQWLEERLAEKIRKTAIVTGALAVILILLTLIFSRILSRPLKLASNIIQEYHDNEDSSEGTGKFPRISYKAGKSTLYPEAYFQRTPLPILITNAEGEVENANRSLCRFFEMNHPDVLGKHLKSLLGENDFKILKNHIDTSGGDVNGYLAVIPAKDGKKRIIEINLALLRDENDILQGFIVTFLDVSNNFQTQREILENQTRLSGLNKKLLQKATELETAHEKNMKYARKLAQLIKISYDIIRCNSNREIMNILVSSGTKLLDAEECIVFLWEGPKKHLKPVESFPGKLLKRLHPITAKESIVWKTYQDNRSYFLNESSLQPQDYKDLGIPETEALDLIAVPISDEDYHYGVAVYLQRRKYVLFTEDMHLITALAHQSAITLDKIQLFQALEEKARHLENANADLKNSRQQVVHLQKMESLGTLVGGIAHDFNNIMGIIIPNIDLLRLSAGDNPEVLKRAYTIQKAAERAAELNRQMLMFSRTHEVKLAPLSPNQLIREIVAMLRKALGKEITVQLKLDPAIPEINADDTRLSQVLMNLAINARDAMPEGGTITFLTAVEEYRPSANPEAQPGNYVKITVRDTGTGISKENLEKIFDPFFTTKSVDKGTGLGLSVVYGIIKSHEGYIEVESTPGKGTAFHLYFKRVEVIAEQPAEAQVSGYTNGNENILVVDDEAGIRDMLGELLASLGYKVLLAENGNIAVETVRNNKEIFVAIVDYTMPKMNGIETIKAIHQIDGNIRILLSSGYADQARIIHKYPHIDGFLPKPYHINEVARIVKETLKKRVVSEN